jgi:dihydrodipicolinate synthase/N-acetylneuraminate lyase
MGINWTGVFPALTTKFTKQDTLDFGVFGNNLEAQINAGVNGVIIGGSLGEASVLSSEEKEALIKVSVEKAEGRIPVLLNIAEGSTKEAIRQVDLARHWGAKGVMVLPPMRYKSDHRETVTFFGTIAASTDLPIIIYNNPIDYKTEVTGDMFEALLGSYSNIEAVKDSTRDVSNVTRLINRFGSRLKILCGVDTLAMEALQMGAHGWVAGLVCAFPQETVSIFRLIGAGRIQEALEIYRWFMPLLELDIHTKLVQYIKLAESETGLGTEYVRAPRLILEGEERKQVLEKIRQGIATRPALPGIDPVSEAREIISTRNVF